MKGSTIPQVLSARLEVGVCALTLPGQTESGDQWLTKDLAGGVLLAAVDGCGHGAEAALASKTALAVVETDAEKGVIPLINRCHEELKGTRGVAMSLASFDVRESTLTWIGVGNVDGVLFRGQPWPRHHHERLLLRAGLVGYHLPPLQATMVPISPGDTMVFTTDGIHAYFTAEVSPHQAAQALADEISAGYRKGTDDSLVLVARYLG